MYRAKVVAGAATCGGWAGEPGVGVAPGAGDVSLSGAASSLVGLAFFNLFRRPSGSSGSNRHQLFAGGLQERLQLGVLDPYGLRLFRHKPVEEGKAMTQSKSPRSAPKTKPSERSSGPTFESRMASEILTVMIETMISVAKRQSRPRQPAQWYLC